MKHLFSVLLVLILGLGVSAYTPESYAGWKTKAAATACALKKGCREVVAGAKEKAVQKCKEAHCIDKATTLAKNGATKVFGYLAKKKALQTAISTKQLQSKFKHAGDFGVQGNYSPANALRFKDAIVKHIGSKSTEAVKGTYRGGDAVIFINKDSGLGVITKPSGEFISGWKFTADKLSHLFSKGAI